MKTLSDHFHDDGDDERAASVMEQNRGWMEWIKVAQDQVKAWETIRAQDEVRQATMRTRLESQLVEIRARQRLVRKQRKETVKGGGGIS